MQVGGGGGRYHYFQMGVIEMKNRVGCVQTRVMVLARSGDSVYPWVMLIPPRIDILGSDQNLCEILLMEHAPETHAYVSE